MMLKVLYLVSYLENFIASYLQWNNVIKYAIKSTIHTDTIFSKEVYYNLLLLPIITLAEIMYFGQGVMNGCKMAQTQAAFKFLYVFVLVIILEVFLVELFASVALCIFCITGLANLLCFITCMGILSFRDWKLFCDKIRKYIDIQNNSIEQDFHHLKI